MTLPRFGHRALPTAVRGEDPVENERRYRAEVERALSQGDNALRQIDSTFSNPNSQPIPWTATMLDGNVVTHPNGLSAGPPQPAAEYNYNPDTDIWAVSTVGTWRPRATRDATWHIKISGLPRQTAQLIWSQSPGNANIEVRKRTIVADTYFQWRFQYDAENRQFYGLATVGAGAVTFTDLMIEIRAT